MPKEKTVTVYKFSELSEKAKDAFRFRCMSADGYPYEREAMDTLRALVDHFGGKLVDWSIDWGEGSYSSAKFDMPDLSEKEIASRLDELGAVDPKTGKGLGECKLTGYFHDEDAIDGFRTAFHGGERDLVKLMRAAFDSWLSTAQADYSYCYTDEQMSETADANEWEFFADGSMA